MSISHLEGFHSTLGILDVRMKENISELSQKDVAHLVPQGHCTFFHVKEPVAIHEVCFVIEQWFHHFVYVLRVVGAVAVEEDYEMAFGPVEGLDESFADSPVTNLFDQLGTGLYGLGWRIIG